jgi:antirestriction protein ArdC
MKTNELYQQVTNQIVAQLEKGVAPWKRPWATIGGGFPKNSASGRCYRGMNVLLLWSAAEANGYDSNLWGTFRQWKALDGHVNKGEHGTKIVFWNVLPKMHRDRDTGEEVEEKVFVAREYTVFNLAQCGGTALDRFRVVRPIGNFVDFGPAEEAISATGADVRHGGNAAFFHTKNDYIQLPVKEAFASPASYYSTALHELSHWSGHESRLNRLDKLARFGDKSYAAEELVAELGAAFLTASLGVPNERTLDDASAYLGNWLSILKTDSKAIFTAASAASAAADYVLSFSQTVESSEEPEAIAA